ncbi:hypothetical protein F3Y22_tig00116951pilonHSYRG00945 [Hibiscus syriacus]|uniref:CMP/dCMP-type deaminase domain-containing protein n=1 Tax=Hibiscus syriacus TaxID=106335 RepID=A0A6A2XR12_HIBSY|nr:hypothetical protein F3Y22_tig00116951pilonHSYRG00945 [Hibiscus syriacus]
MMQIQLLSFPNCTQPPASISASPHGFTSFSTRHQLPKLVGNLHFPPSSFNSSKRGSRFQFRSRKCGGLARVRCEVVEDDGFYMRRCVELARTAIGFSSPNPMVGCVIVKDGKVVVGMVDPNPFVASKGVDRLTDAGIDVTVGVEEELCKGLNEAYIHQMLTGKPFMTLRYYLSVNSHLLDQLGEGVIEAGGYYSKLLQEYDVIIISGSLTEKLSSSMTREPVANQPLQIVIASDPDQLHPLSKEVSKTSIFRQRDNSRKRFGSKRTQGSGVGTDKFDSNSGVLETSGVVQCFLDMRGSFANLEGLVREAIEQKKCCKR